MIMIRRMNEYERNEVALFVRQVMRIQYHCDPHELPEIMFVGWREGKFVGAMALSLSAGEPLPLEETYALDYGSFPGVFNRARIAQLGRWVATVSDLSEALVYAAIQYAIHKNREWGIGEIKPQVARRFSRMGIRIFRLSGGPLLGHIPESVRPYYLLPPVPIPAAIALLPAERVLRERMEALIAQGKIRFSPP